MWRLNLWKIPGAFPAAFVIMATAGCYTQLRTDVFNYESQREPPQSHIVVEGLSVRTDRPWYQRPATEEYVTIGATFENHGDMPVLLSGCPEPPQVVIEGWDGAEWHRESIIGSACFGINSSKTVEIGPGESLEFELLVRDPGWHRLGLSVGPDWRRPAATVSSNQFLVR